MALPFRMCAAAVLVGLPSAATAQRFVDVSITGNDYAYVNPPKTLAAASTVFSFENTGAQRHEMILARLRPGVSADSAGRALAAGVPFQETIVAPNGVLIAPPRAKSSGRLLVELERGSTYLIICYFQDTPEKAHHSALGMFTFFKVE